LPNGNIFIGAFANVAGVPFGFSTKESAFASIGSSLTDTQTGNYYTAVQAFQTSLSRQV
jgi:hypothetical protein